VRSLLDIVYKACKSRLADFMTSGLTHILLSRAPSDLYIGRQCFKQNLSKTVNIKQI